MAKSRAAFQSVVMARDLADLILERGLPIQGLQFKHKSLGEHCRGFIEMAMAKGICRPFYKNEKLKAIFLIGEVPFAPGFSLYWGIIESDGSREAGKWLIERLKENRSFMTENSILEMPVHLRGLIPHLYRLGYFIDSVRTIGDATIALPRLLSHKRAQVDIKDHGLTVSRLKSISELRQIREIEKREFKRNPKFGWFQSTEGWLTHATNRRRENMSDKTIPMFVFKKGNRVVGFFAGTPDSRYFRPRILGIEFVFDRSIQGKGLSYIAYRVLLEAMLEHGSKFFLGNTAQSPVMKLSKLMGRRPMSYSLRFGKAAFPHSHFMK
jgi:hypothetical protein